MSSSIKPQPSLPTLKKPFGWDLVTVLDPRVSGRTLQLWLMIRECPLIKPKGAPAYIATPVKRVLVSPMVPSDKNSSYSGRETLSFAVVDTRYPSQMVELCFTPRQAELFRRAFAPAEKAVPSLTAQEGHPRFRCYILGCKATSSDIDFVGAHFEQGLHPGIEFEKEKVQVFRVNGPCDPAALQTQSPFPLPLALKTLEGRLSSTASYAVLPGKPSSLAKPVPAISSKRPREHGSSSDVQASNAATSIVGVQSEFATTPDGPQLDTAGTRRTSRGVDQLVDAYMKKHPVAEEIQAEDQELLCECLQPEDDRPMIACSNGESCRLQWYHLECLDMTLNDLPDNDVPWFCPECITKGRQGKKRARAASLAPIDATPRKKPRPSAVRKRAQQAMTEDMQDVESAIDGGSSDDALSPPWPSRRIKPWSADMVSSFAEDSDNIQDYNLTTLVSAKAALRARAAEPVGQPRSKRSTFDGENVTYSSNYKSPNCRSWTAEEEQHLKDVVKECADSGLAGEALWAAAHPKLVARGVNRPVGGMKMRWCRGLRDETKIDERRKKNKTLLTAVQKPKTERDPDVPKKGRFKGKAYHATRRASGSNNVLPHPASTRLTQSCPTAMPIAVPVTATFPLTATDFHGGAESMVAHKRSASV